MQENILSVETDPIVMHIYIVQPAFFPLIAAALVQLPINSSQACQAQPARPSPPYRAGALFIPVQPPGLPGWSGCVIWK